MTDAHLSALQAKHRGLDSQIAEEMRRPAPNEGLLATLKRQKLKIKEALSR